MKQPGKLVAIHQPNFFPWLGYFSKIALCDKFVFLDDVQLPRTGAGSWVNRVHVFIGGKVQWLTLPIDKASGGLRSINEVRIVADERWRKKNVDSIHLNYRKAPFHGEVFPVVEGLLISSECNLAEFNVRAILAIAGKLGIPESTFVRSSALSVSGYLSTDRLVQLVKAVDGTAYLYGGAANAADGYQENEKFVEAGLTPVAQDFRHPLYSQVNTESFQPGLSVIDALMNVGFDGARRLLLPDSIKT
jgi:hypothetical protein